MTTLGAKRAATSDPATPDLPSKKVMDEPSFIVNRAESFHQHVMAEPATLDPGRAEAASKHVRALNTQFASWVQLQLQNHPLEIWEDGLKDYMSHASEIMDKFKDVVNWLRKNKVGPKGASSPDPHKDVKTTLTAADGSKSVIVQTSSDSGQKVTIVSPSVSQSPNSQNLFSLSSQQKPPALSGTFGDKGTHLVKLANQFSSLVETVAYLVARILLVTVFAANNGFSTPTSTSIFSNSAAQSFSMRTPALFSVNEQSFPSETKILLTLLPMQMKMPNLRSQVAHL